MCKISPEVIFVSSQAFFIHNNPGFRSGFTLTAQYKPRVCDFAVGAVQVPEQSHMETSATGKGEISSPFQEGPRRGGEQERRSRHPCTQGHFCAFPLSTGCFFEVCRRGWSAGSSSIRAVAPAGWIAQTAPTQVPCVLAHTHSSPGTHQNCQESVEHVPRLW